MLTATPRNWFSWNYTLTQDAHHLADLDISWWREKGTLTVHGQPYSVYRERLPVRVFVTWLTVVLWKRDSDGAAAGGLRRRSGRAGRFDRGWHWNCPATTVAG